MKCHITLIICIFCVSIILASCADTAPVSTSGQLSGTEDTDSTEQTDITSEETVKEIKDYFETIEKYKSNINNDNIIRHIDSGFINWICDNHDPEFAKVLSDALEHNSYKDTLWHDRTGYSFNVLWDYYSGTPYTEENNIYVRESSEKESVSLAFAGDLCLSEGWYTLNKYDEMNGDLNRCISGGLIEQLQNADIFMLNNEFTFSNSGTPLEGKYYTFRANTDRISILKSLGTDVVSIANNHIFDFGETGFYDTLTTLRNNNIPFFGGGKNSDEASRPVYFIINGMKIGFVGASRAEKIRYTPGASSDSPGVLLTYDNTQYLNVISEAKRNCDYLIAYVHWGTEDSHEVTDYQKIMGRQFIDAGADIVVGGHPHVLQGIEYYREKPILYSLGDFWFNYETKETGVIEIDITSSGLKSMKFLPCIQDNYTTSLISEPSEGRRIYDFLQNLSYDITIDDNGYITKTAE